MYIQELDEMLVDFSDPRWSTIDCTQFKEIAPGLTVEHFPIMSRGQRSVRPLLIYFDRKVSLREAEVAVMQRGHRPDRAEAETFVELNPEQSGKAPIVAFCGERLDLGNPGDIVLYRAHLEYRYLTIHPPAIWFSKFTRFLVIQG